MRDPINQRYLQITGTLKSVFTKQKSLALGQFLNQDEFVNLKALCMTGWTQQCIPDQYSYETRTPTPEEEALRKHLAAFAKKIAGKQPLAETTKRFKHGSFTLLHDKADQKPGVLLLLFLDNWNEEWGGSTFFTKHGETLASFTPQANTLLLIERPKGVRSFVKYVNHKAGKRSFVVFS